MRKTDKKDNRSKCRCAVFCEKESCANEAQGHDKQTVTCSNRVQCGQSNKEGGDRDEKRRI